MYRVLGTRTGFRRRSFGSGFLVQVVRYNQNDRTDEMHLGWLRAVLDGKGE